MPFGPSERSASGPGYLLPRPTCTANSEDSSRSESEPAMTGSQTCQQQVVVADQWVPRLHGLAAGDGRGFLASAAGVRPCPQESPTTACSSC